MKAAVYARISADREGRELGVARQQADARALAEKRGWEVGEVFVDNDVSAVKERPAWNRMLTAIAEGKVDAVVSYSSSRLYRDVDVEKGRLFAACLEQDKQGHRIPIETVVSGSINPYTADGRTLANIMASIDQGERERVSERTRRSVQQRAERGQPIGPLGFGWSNDGTVIDAEAALIREAATDILNGVSQTTIAERWNHKGLSKRSGEPWRRQDVRRVVTRPTVAGLIVHNGKEHRSKHEAIIDVRTWRRVLAALDQNRNGNANRRYLLTGLIVCAECGSRMTGAPDRHRKPTYQCTPERRGEKHGHVVRIRAQAVSDYVVQQASWMTVEEQRVPREVDENLLEELTYVETLIGKAVKRSIEEDWSPEQEQATTAEWRERKAEIERQLGEPQTEQNQFGWLLEHMDDEPLDRDELRRDLEVLIDKVVVRRSPRRPYSPVEERVAIVWKPGVRDVREAEVGGAMGR